MRTRFWNPHRHWHSGAPLDTNLADFPTVRVVFGLWIAAFILKHIGASWDVAWHFRFLRDDLIPPHIVNLSGNFLTLGLLYYQYLTRTAVERTGFLMLLAGFALFHYSGQRVGFWPATAEPVQPGALSELGGGGVGDPAGHARGRSFVPCCVRD